jgi:predicted transcriptional regulator
MDQQPSITPLRKWRENQRKTQDWCASQIGTSRQVWSDWERGRRIPNKDVMPKVVHLTGGEVQAGDFYPQLEQAA